VREIAAIRGRKPEEIADKYHLVGLEPEKPAGEGEE
jgi:hypothetical protein